MDARPATTPPRHHPHHHAAARTDDYIFAQLIPYIGNKRRLLPLIWTALRATSQGIKGSRDRGIRGRGAAASSSLPAVPQSLRPSVPLFADLFTGSTVVARLAKTLGFRTLANDWEPYSHQVARGTVALNRPPAFAALGGVDAVFATLNALPPREGYFTRHLCPADDERPDHEQERLFFTRRNGLRIDAVRAQLAQWQTAGQLSDDELAFVLSAFIYAVSYVSNTSGVFKGFHRGWGGKTATALYRIRSDLTLRPPVLFDNGQPNLASRMDAQELAAGLTALAGQRADVVYLDPPYNQHPYGSNYHVLTTIALGDEPPVSPGILVGGRTVDKSAIRRDWRTLRRSAYNTARAAPDALRRLIESIDARCILMSYSTDGNIPLEHVLAPLAARGRLQVFTQKYKRYRVSTPRMSPRGHNVEFVAVVETQGRRHVHAVERCAAEIRGAEDC